MDKSRILGRTRSGKLVLAPHEDFVAAHAAHRSDASHPEREGADVRRDAFREAQEKYPHHGDDSRSQTDIFWADGWTEEDHEDAVKVLKAFKGDRDRKRLYREIADGHEARARRFREDRLRRGRHVPVEATKAEIAAWSKVEPWKLSPEQYHATKVGTTYKDSMDRTRTWDDSEMDMRTTFDMHLANVRRAIAQGEDVPVEVIAAHEGEKVGSTDVRGIEIHLARKNPFTKDLDRDVFAAASRTLKGPTTYGALLDVLDKMLPSKRLACKMAWNIMQSGQVSQATRLKHIRASRGW